MRRQIKRREFITLIGGSAAALATPALPCERTTHDEADYRFHWLGDVRSLGALDGRIRAEAA